MTTQLHPKAIYYFLLRHIAALLLLGLIVWPFVSGQTVYGTVNGHPTEWIAPPAFRGAFVIASIILFGLILLYTRALVRSYHIELRKDGVALSYGVINLTNELLLFPRIQDIVINRNIIERVLGLSTLTIQNATGKPEMIPGLGITTAEKLRDDVLSHISK